MATIIVYKKHHNSLITVSITRNISPSKMGAKDAEMIYKKHHNSLITVRITRNIPPSKMEAKDAEMRLDELQTFPRGKRQPNYR